MRFDSTKLYVSLDLRFKGSSEIEGLGLFLRATFWTEKYLERREDRSLKGGYYISNAKGSRDFFIVT